MAEGVSCGMGRTGPWLQNAWLRIESRQGDGSISPIALSGSFRPTERAIAYAECEGEAPFHFERSDYDFARHEDAIGAGRRLTIRCALPRRGVTLRREIVLYDVHPFCLVRVGVTDAVGGSHRLRAMHAFTTQEARGAIRLAADPDAWRIYRHGWQSWSPTMSLGGTERDVLSAPPVLAPEQPAGAAGRFASDDVGVIFDPIARRSLLAGAVTANDFLTQVAVDAPARSVDARCLGDATTIAAGKTAWSEWCMVDLVGQPNEQLARYGDALGRMMGARVPAVTPAGWCSWYYFFTGVTEEDVVRNLRFLEQHRREMPIQTVQIDDGYQADIGDWTITNEKFPRGMDWLAREIRQAGYTPGLWLAPFLVAASSKLYAQQPDWVVRDDGGAPIVATNNWLRNNFGLDGSHPDARAWLTGLFREVCDGWGYDYVKIDFLFGAAISGRRFDPDATRARAYRDALEAVRAGVGEDRFILGCGALMAPSVGMFDGNRIGPDVAPFWRNLTTSERSQPMARPRRPDDRLSVETSIRNTLQRSWMHGRLWANDPDCLLVRTDRTKLSLDETRTLASIIGLSGGMMLCSDDLPQIPGDRLDIISMLLPVLPASATAVDLIERDMPERYETVFERESGELRIVGVFNFDDLTRDLTFTLPPGRWHVFELWEERYRGIVEGEMVFSLVSAHACRVVALRPATGQPMTVATTAHIGMGALDIMHEHYDDDARVLRATLTTAGKRVRRIYVAASGRTVERASFDGSEVDVVSHRGDLASVEVSVDIASDLELAFGIPAVDARAA